MPYNLKRAVEELNRSFKADIIWIFISRISGCFKPLQMEQVLQQLRCNQLQQAGGNATRRQRKQYADTARIVIVNSKFLKFCSKAKRRAPAYSRALRHIRGVVQRSMSSGGPSPVATETTAERQRRVSLRMRKLGRRSNQGRNSSRGVQVGVASL